MRSSPFYFTLSCEARKGEGTATKTRKHTHSGAFLCSKEGRLKGCAKQAHGACNRVFLVSDRWGRVEEMKDGHAEICLSCLVKKTCSRRPYGCLLHVCMAQWEGVMLGYKLGGSSFRNISGVISALNQISTSFAHALGSSFLN